MLGTANFIPQPVETTNRSAVNESKSRLASQPSDNQLTARLPRLGVLEKQPKLASTARSAVSLACYHGSVAATLALPAPQATASQNSEPQAASIVAVFHFITHDRDIVNDSESHHALQSSAWSLRFFMVIVLFGHCDSQNCNSEIEQPPRNGLNPRKSDLLS